MLTVVADDLTGAAEVAGVCLRFGLNVVFGINKLPEGEADVKVIATDSRQSGREEAIRIHRNIAETLKIAGITEIFKKTDSVLRGYVIDELEQIMDIYGYETVILQPSNPGAGRIIRKGKYKISGVPLNQTPFSGDPDFPAASDNVIELLEIRSAGNGIEINSILVNPEMKGIIVPDCSSGADMRRQLTSKTDNCFFAGSAAFLGAYLKIKLGRKMSRKTLNFNPFEGRFLMICGSTHYQSQDFIMKAASKGISVSIISKKLMQKDIDENALEKFAQRQSECWNDLGRLIITYNSEPIQYEDCTGILKKRMSSLVSMILKKSPVVELLIEGGATAFSILTELGWTALNPVKELAPGVVRMQVLNNPGFYIIMKPGSYPWPEYLNI